eukprot:scaffold2816_cov121-Cylindrotheca_fusiformis.AAC.28
MTPEDLRHCQNVVKALRKEKNNYLFLEPFDLTQVPGYTDVVKKVMDISTLSKNLDAGVYPDREAFSKDCFLIYENAIAYHGTRPTAWIADLAKSMLKIAKDKYSNVGKKKDPSGKNKKLLPTKKNKKVFSEGGTTTESGGTKLKLKLGGPAKITKPPIQGKQAPSIADEKEDKKVKKPRLTLKLGKPKTPEGTNVAKSSPKPSPKASPKPTSSSNTSKVSPKVVGNSRGKELPKGVAPPKAEQKKGTKKTTAKRKATDGSVTKSKKIKLSAATSQANRGGVVMNSTRQVQCVKVLNGLKHRQSQSIAVFLQPVSDKTIVKDYKSKIEYPMDLGTMQAKLERNEYPTVSAFVYDLRRIFSNCLRYNTSLKDAFRPVAVDVLTTAEQLMTVFLAQPEYPTSVYPPLLFCWKLCLSVLDTLYNLTNPEDGAATALYFLYPVTHYCGGQYPPGYLEKVKKPMDFGTVTKQLLEGQYTSVEQFEADCRLVLDNCIAYYGGREDGKMLTDQANRLSAVLQQQMTALKKYIKAPPGEALRRAAQNAVNTTSLPKPPIHLLQGILDELRSLKYTDKATKVKKPSRDGCL